MITSLLLTVAPKAEYKTTTQIQMHKRVCCIEEGFYGSLGCDIKLVGSTNKVKWCNSPLGGLNPPHNLAAVNSFVDRKSGHINYAR